MSASLDMNDKTRTRDYFCDPVRRRRRSIAWGIALILAGGLFLADRLGALSLGPVWHYWPLAIVVAGLIDILTLRHIADAVHGLMLAAIGVWLYACLERLWGFTFANSWPVVLIAIGATTLAEGLTRRKRSTNEELRR